MKLVCNIDELLSSSGMSEAELASAVGIDKRTLDHLQDDSENWRLSRQQIETLMIQAFLAGLENIFSIRHHPIWTSFLGTDSIIFRGQRALDARIEHEVSTYLRHMGGKPATRQVTTKPKASDVAKAMKTTNCLFVGSPKSNPATEIALCLLSGAQPFDDRPANRQRLPFQIIVADYSKVGTSALFSKGTRFGFSVPVPDQRTPDILDVTWRPRPLFDTWHGEGNEAAIVAICRSPFETAKAVTTVLVMGYSGLSTQVAMQQLIRGTVPLTESDFSERKVHLLAYEFQFKKPQGTSSRSRVDPRREIRGTSTWSHLR